MAAAPLPPVEQVAPGLWAIPVPIPINPLRYVLVYVFETDAGVYLVDAGWNTEDAWAALAAGLVESGHALTDVRGVLVTHIHPDHYGLAGRIRGATGAWLALHPADAALLHDRYFEPEGLIERVAAILRTAGAPEEEVRDLEFASMPVLGLVDVAEPDILVEDGDPVDVPGWGLVPIWTPGHSPGHLCFYAPERKIMLTGDHVLPRITPNISLHPQSGPDPLGDFLRSLDRVASYDTGLVLPAHEHRFVGLAERVAELHRHHEQRFAEVLDAVADGDDTAWAVTTRMHWSRPWERIDGFMRRAALGEAAAHIAALQARGRLRLLPGSPLRWAIVP